MRLSGIEDTRNLDVYKFLDIMLTNVGRTYRIKSMEGVAAADAHVIGLRYDYLIGHDGREAPSLDKKIDALYDNHIRAMESGLVKKLNGNVYEILETPDAVRTRLEDGWRHMPIDMGVMEDLCGRSGKNQGRVKSSLQRDFMVQLFNTHGYSELSPGDVMRLPIASWNDNVFHYFRQIESNMFNSGVLEIYGNSLVKPYGIKLVQPKLRLRGKIFDDSSIVDRVNVMGYSFDRPASELDIAGQGVLDELSEMPQPFTVSEVSRKKTADDLGVLQLDRYLDWIYRLRRSGHLGVSTSYLKSASPGTIEVFAVRDFDKRGLSLDPECNIIRA